MNIKFYDPKTKTVTEMPEDELAPGCIKVKITGMEGDYFMRADAVNLGGDFRHPPFDAELKAMMSDLEETFRDVMPMSAQEWEEGFRRDNDAEREIATWLFMADHYKRLTQDPKTSLNAKRDYFAIITTCTSSGENQVRNLIQLHELSWEDVDEVIASLKKGAD